MTEDEFHNFASSLSDADMRRLRKEFIFRFDARMEQLSHFIRSRESDVERLALGGFGSDSADPELVAKLADFALFFCVTDDNRRFVNDLERERADLQ